MPLPKSSTPVYELELPSIKKKIKYRPFLVKEEKVLIMALESQDMKQITGAVKNVLSSCILSRGVKVENLSTFDIEYLFLNVRGKSVGELIDVIVTCPDDGETEVEVQINFDGGDVSIDQGFDIITSCVDQVYSEEESWNTADCTKKELDEFVGNLTSSQFAKVEKFFSTMPKLTHTLKVTNPKTGVENEVVLEGLASFFA
jgi:hypothetical protein